MGKKVRVIVSLLVIAIIAVLIIPPQESTDVISLQTDAIDSVVIESDDIVLDQDIIDQAFQEFSIVETDRVFTKSDQSLIDQFLDEQGLPSSSEKFGIEVQTVLFDSSQTQFTSSSILSIPELLLTDSEGRLLDLGSIQTSFAGIVSNNESGEETSFSLEGTVKFYLDDTLITTKKLYSSEQGAVSQTGVYELSLVDTIPPSSFDRPQAFTFTLSDEGRDWVNGSEHTYRVVITDISAELSSNKDIEKYSWNGEKIAYELKVKLDETKKVVLGEDNYAISILKNDSTIQVCGSSMYQNGYSIKTPKLGLTTVSPPSVVVTDLDGNVLSSIEDFSAGNAGKSSGNITTYANTCSEKIGGIPRDADVIFTVDGKDYPIHTPLTQFNYNIDQGLEKTGQKSCVVYRNSHHCAYYYAPSTPTSNFGFP